MLEANSFFEASVIHPRFWFEKYIVIFYELFAICFVFTIY